jgi:hypothetical protein
MPSPTATRSGSSCSPGSRRWRLVNRWNAGAAGSPGRTTVLIPGELSSRQVFNALRAGTSGNPWAELTNEQCWAVANGTTAGDETVLVPVLDDQVEFSGLRAGRRTRLRSPSACLLCPLKQDQPGHIGGTSRRVLP